MQILPAIDLHNGHCVRLTQGDFGKKTVYETDILVQAQHFIEQGATWCHVVDLDAAKDPSMSQFSTIKDLLVLTPLSIQTGGGIRNADQVRERLESGVQRVVIGSLAVQSPDEVIALLNQYGANCLVIAIDVFIKDDKPMVATHGWQQTSEKDCHEVIGCFLEHGLKHVLVTDIYSDGTLLGPNFALYQQLQQRYPSLALQASGGVQQLDDILRLRALGMSGVVIGKALYEKRFSLQEALSC